MIKKKRMGRKLLLYLTFVILHFVEQIVFDIFILKSVTVIKVDAFTALYVWYKTITVWRSNTFKYNGHLLPLMSFNLCSQNNNYTLTQTTACIYTTSFNTFCIWMFKAVQTKPTKQCAGEMFASCAMGIWL